MVKFYVNRIEKGLMILEDVPKLWKTKVEDAIKKESEVNEKNGQNI